MESLADGAMAPGALFLFVAGFTPKPRHLPPLAVTSLSRQDKAWPARGGVPDVPRQE